MYNERSWPISGDDKNEHATTRTKLAYRAVSQEDRQTGGGCVGGLFVRPRNLSFVNDRGTASTMYRSVTTVDGKNTPTKLMHLSAHATELLELSWSLQHGQQGMSTLAGIDISAGFTEIAAAWVAGTKATETATRTAKNVRTLIMRGYYRAVHAGGQQRRVLCGLAAGSQ
jgi:hypothetical protein